MIFLGEVEQYRGSEVTCFFKPYVFHTCKTSHLRVYIEKVHLLLHFLQIFRQKRRMGIERQYVFAGPPLPSSPLRPISEMFNLPVKLKF
jgi:hypothetical protein